eukprot:TRINITY_DN6956_c0_g1_i1.p1 TRINITY_DN6956_c0_g1~~TRINITY_DN6956_c0_g1_i1.p1  ORF type:complete len:332 (+),score=54.41 TRINITY_DN6956_c0_g1_i1:78-1073(+)
MSAPSRALSIHLGKMEHKNVGVLVLKPMMDYLLGVLEEKFRVYKLWPAEDPKTFLKKHGASIQAIVCTTSSIIGLELLNSLPSVEIVCTNSVGLDHIDLKECKKRNIRVADTRDVLNDEVADLALALILSTLRQVHSADRYVREGLWETNGDFKLTTKFTGKTVGIFGLGRIGMAIAKRSEAFSCKIEYHSRSKRVDVPYTYHSSLHDLVKSSDVLVVACPLTPETWHIIDRSVLDALGPKAILVNIARGGLLDEEELVKALVEGRLGGAGLDVFENEPYVPKELFDLENVVLLPHVGCATFETRKDMADLVIHNLEAHFSNKPLLTSVDL